MKIKNIIILLALIFVSIACTVTRVTPTATNILISTLTPLPLVPTITPTPAQEKSELGTDNTILAAIIEAIAAIIAAIIGAAGAMSVALMSKKYADNQISNSKPSDEIKPSVKLIIRFLGLFRVTGASVFIVKIGKTYIDNETGISIAIHNLYPALGHIDITYQLPGPTKPQEIVEARLGWRILVNYQDSLYALTLVSFDGSPFSGSARFDFRKVNYRRLRRRL